jgi:hypothetical protein
LRSEDITAHGTTWYARTAASKVLLAISASKTPFGNLEKASSAVAKTANGLGTLRVSTRPAAFIASVRILKLPAAIAVLTRSF